jgi:hypothetical protein
MDPGRCWPKRQWSAFIRTRAIFRVMMVTATV